MRCPRWSPYALILFTACALAGAQEETPRSALETRLDEKRVTFQFLSTPARDAFAFLSRTGEVSILLAPGAPVDEAVTFSARDMTLRRAIRWVAYLAGVDFVVGADHVLVAGREEIAARSAVSAVLDVRDLTSFSPDMPGPDLSFGRMDAGAVLEVSETEPLDADTLVDYLTILVAPESWESPNSIYFERGMLFVRHRREVIEEVGRTLDRIRAHQGRMVSVEATLYLVPAAVWAEHLTAEGSDRPLDVVGAESWGRVREALRSAQAVTVLHRLRTIGAPAQRVHAFAERVEEYVADVDVQIAGGAAAAEAIVERFRGGAVLDVRPVPTPDGKSISMQVRFDLAQASMARRSKFGNIWIHLPRVDGLLVRTTVRVPDGGAWLLTTTHPLAGEEARFVLAVHPRSLRGEEENR